ncbi:MAG: hypothetical protein Q3M24_04925 [Candidatus Electrothrix aestuarii]|uniref:Uncharacterized protein n=1 Tax=Candidatus Electrothrix aestuarii TaxID=3062594 RepID=A0AAU8LZ11_9BACT
MKFFFTAVLLFSFFLSVNYGDDVFASEPIPRVCGGYNEKGDTCIAACKLGESATCFNTKGEKKPQCSCEAENSDQSFNDFLKRLKAKIEQANMFQNDLNHIHFLGNVTFKVDRDYSPDGKLVLGASALCNALSYTDPPSIPCEVKIIDPLIIE